MEAANEFPVEKMCSVFEVSRSGYYRWRKASQSSPEDEAKLDNLIKASFEKSRCTYGSPRVTIDLVNQGVHVSESTVARRMKALKISPKRRKKFIHTTDSNHKEPIAPNLLDRDFSATRRAQKWVSDITYFKIGRRWYYLTVIIDLADRAVISWTISDNMTTQHTTLKALEKALRKRKPEKNMLFHSDRGVQYACLDFCALLKQNNCIQSMSRKGNCWDNAVAESFFKTIKTECLNRYEFTSYQQAYSVIFDYIEGWFNTCRIHTAIGGIPPDQVVIQKKAA